MSSTSNLTWSLARPRAVFLKSRPTSAVQFTSISVFILKLPGMANTGTVEFALNIQRKFYIFKQIDDVRLASLPPYS